MSAISLSVIMFDWKQLLSNIKTCFLTDVFTLKRGVTREFTLHVKVAHLVARHIECGRPQAVNLTCEY